MTRSEMHLMHNPLEFAQSVGNFIGNLSTDLYPSVVMLVIVAFQVIIFKLSVKCQRIYFVGMDVGDCGIYFVLQNISSMIYNYFK